MAQKEEKKPVEQPRKRRKVSEVSPPPLPAKTTDSTGKMIKQMSIIYSLAIKRNPDSQENMKKKKLVGFYHIISTDDAPQHQYCNVDWCKYLQAQTDNKPYTHKPELSKEVQEMVKPVYEKLCDDELISRCLGKNTQNNNECYNKTLWAIVPKHTFVGKNVVELVVYVSLSIFNEERMTLLKILEIMGCAIGISTYNYVRKKDEERIAMAENASKAATKEGRLARKEAQQELEQVEQDSGVLLYGPGIAD